MNMVYTSKRGKQIVFDDFTDNTEEYGSYWVEMCPHCHNKYRGILGKRADDGGTASGTCSVRGCQNEADYYVDFEQNEVGFVTEAWSIVPGADAVFLPGKIHGCEWQAYIIYHNEDANEGRGSWEIEVVDKERILELYVDTNGSARHFFELLPDRFQGEWYYCDNGMDGYDEYTEAYPVADFIVGRDGWIEEEMMFLVNWARQK